MPIDPGTAMLIAAAVNAAASAGSAAISGKKKKKADELRSREMRRETEAGILNESLQREAEKEADRLQKKKRMGSRQAETLQGTANLIRGALNI